MALSKITNASVADTAVHGRRNLIINGAMQVDQRGSASAKKTGNEYSVDRTRVAKSGFDQLAYEHGQSTESPDGFSNSLHVKVTTAETALAAEELFYMTHKIEAQNLQHLQYGTSEAKKTTLSFWVRSSLTGTYSVNFYQSDATRSNLQTFSVSTADTWEYKTITINGDTSGAINNDNGDGLNIHFILAAGSNWHGTPHTGWGAYVATDDFASSSNVDFSAQTGNFYITGIQWEVGDTATPFEHARSYGEELALCQRYFERLASGQADCLATMAVWISTAAYGVITFQPKRINPSITHGAYNNFRVRASTANHVATQALEFDDPRKEGYSRVALVSTGMTGGEAGWLSGTSSGSTIDVDAEL